MHKRFEFFNEIGIIAQLSRALMEARLPDGLLLTHFGVLNHLIRLGDGRTPLQIAQAFQVPKTSMTHTLAGLEKRGLVAMRPNPKDARSKQVFLTDAGRALVAEAQAQVGADFGPRLADFPDEYFDDVLPKLRAMREHLDNNRE